MADPTLYHAPNTRSFAALVLLEELGVPFDLHVLDMQKDEQRSAAFLAINPLGKVPTLKHGDAVVTEQVAIALYLADRFPDRRLAPGLDDALRGPYLRWMVFYAACFEPAMVDRALKREPGPHMMSPYGDAAAVVDAMKAQLGTGPWMLGERFSAADVIWGTAMHWMTQFKIVEPTPAITAYLERYAARPAFARARARDVALAAARQS
jgi:glutathione S-transferase